MAIRAEDLSAVKRYMRVDDDEDDDIISMMYEAAEIYLDDGCGAKPGTADSLYILALWSLTLHYYENRNSIGNEASFPVGLRPIINQLKSRYLGRAEE